MDPGLHYAYTGVDNGSILSNFRRLASEVHHKIVPRTPLVPGLTATLENLKAIECFVRKSGYERSLLLPYNHGHTKKQDGFAINT